MIRPPDSKRRGPRGGSEGPSPLSSFARAPRGSKLVAAPLRSRLYFGMHDGSASPSLPLSLYLTPDRCLTLMLVKVRLGVAWTAVSSTSPAISGSLATDARTLNHSPFFAFLFPAPLTGVAPRRPLTALKMERLAKLCHRGLDWRPLSFHHCHHGANWREPSVRLPAPTTPPKHPDSPTSRPPKTTVHRSRDEVPPGPSVYQKQKIGSMADEAVIAPRASVGQGNGPPTIPSPTDFPPPFILFTAIIIFFPFLLWRSISSDTNHGSSESLACAFGYYPNSLSSHRSIKPVAGQLIPNLCFPCHIHISPCP